MISDCSQNLELLNFYCDYCTDLNFEYCVQIKTIYKLVNKFLNSSNILASINSSGREFHSFIIADGKNDLLLICDFKPFQMADL